MRGLARAAHCPRHRSVRKRRSCLPGDELRREYRLSEDELRLLDVPVCDLPFELPQCTFYARDTQWLLGPGALDICEPFGIGVIFEGERPLRVENLEFCGEY